MYTAGLNDGLSRATQVMQSAMMYKVTKKLLEGNTDERYSRTDRPDR